MNSASVNNNKQDYGHWSIVLFVVIMSTPKRSRRDPKQYAPYAAS